MHRISRLILWYFCSSNKRSVDSIHFDEWLAYRISFLHFPHLMYCDSITHLRVKICRNFYGFLWFFMTESGKDRTERIKTKWQKKIHKKWSLKTSFDLNGILYLYMYRRDEKLILSEWVLSRTDLILIDTRQHHKILSNKQFINWTHIAITCRLCKLKTITICHFRLYIHFPNESKPNAIKMQIPFVQRKR